MEPYAIILLAMCKLGLVQTTKLLQTLCQLDHKAGNKGHIQSGTYLAKKKKILFTSYCTFILAHSKKITSIYPILYIHSGTYTTLKSIGNHMKKQNKKHQNARSIGEKLKKKISCDLQDFKF